MLEPLHDEFMRRAIAEISLIGMVGGTLGCWVVLYRLSYATESLAHSIFPGLVLAAIAGAPLLLGGAPAIVLAALVIAAVSRTPGVSREVAVGAVVTTFLGLGALLALSPESPPGIEGILFGDILGPSDADLAAAAALAVIVAVALLLLHGRLLAGGFDRRAARSLGASPGFAEAVLMVLLAAAIVVAVKGLGNLLVVAVFVGPAAAARNLTERIVPLIAYAVAIALIAGLVGLYLSYYAGTAAGASVVLAIVAAYVLTLPVRGLAAWRREKTALAEATIIRS
jgi:ABC-type Mn2+/Zn2+ transport system permease subunit